MFSHLRLTHWRQFSDVDIRFHERLTVLTGANGAGKTTLLNLLNRHWGWNVPYVSAPWLSKKGLRTYWAGFWASDDPFRKPDEQPGNRTIGHISYRDHPSAQLTVPENVNETFSVGIAPQPSLYGVYVPSHRPLYVHQPVQNIPTQLDARQQIFNNYINEIRNRFRVGHRIQSPSLTLKQSLISLATFGYGNEAVVPDPEAQKTFEGFQEALKRVLPSSLGFLRIEIKVPDVILKTETGDFAFDAVSGGVSALIDVAWQIYLYSLLHDEFVVAIDEPESHLHPQLQQQVMPSLLAAFPQAQFIVATHNPFVVGAVPDSNVYALSYGDDRRVRSQLLDEADRSGTSNDILRDVLGLLHTTPLWVETQLDSIVEKYEGKELNSEVFAALRDDLRALGLEKYTPETLDEVLDARSES